MGAEYDSTVRASADTAGSLLAWLSGARGKVADAAERAQQASEDASKAAVTYIERFPYETVAIAVALGFLMGLLWSRR